MTLFSPLLCKSTGHLGTGSTSWGTCELQGSRNADLKMHEGSVGYNVTSDVKGEQALRGLRPRGRGLDPWSPAPPGSRPRPPRGQGWCRNSPSGVGLKSLSLHGVVSLATRLCLWNIKIACSLIAAFSFQQTILYVFSEKLHLAGIICNGSLCLR